VSAWWTGLAPAQTTLECRGATHRLRWADGELLALDHDDIEGERALAALGDERCACVDTIDGWARSATDLRVLVLASRGPGDAIARPEPQHGHSGWMSYGPGSNQPEDKDALARLLALGGGLPERLVATVAASRLGEHAPKERARLHAALYGRATAALRDWLAEPGLPVELAMEDGPRVVRDGDRLEATLPFSWLVDVWAKGLEVNWGRFCLAAETEDGRRFTLTTVAPDLGEPQRVVLELGG
jgi:hypothetical protein